SLRLPRRADFEQAFVTVRRSRWGESSLRIFKRLTQLSQFRRRHLSFIQTLEDLDLVREIGLHQSQRDPLTLKVLFLKGIASVATVQRRLSRLKRLGVVCQSKVEHDNRL